MEALTCLTCIGLPVIWLMFGIITASTESNRGRSAALGFLGGCLLGPIALILSLCVPEDTKKCPYCSENNKLDARVCKYCGRELP